MKKDSNESLFIALALIGIVTVVVLALWLLKSVIIIAPILLVLTPVVAILIRKWMSDKITKQGFEYYEWILVGTVIVCAFTVLTLRQQMEAFIGERYVDGYVTKNIETYGEDGKGNPVKGMETVSVYPTNTQSGQMLEYFSWFLNILMIASPLLTLRTTRRYKDLLIDIGTIERRRRSSYE